MTKQEELEALKNRIRLGNKKLNEAWEQICKMDHNSEQWKDEFQKWHEANEKLSGFCTKLKVMGFNDCLYLNDKGEKMMSCLGQGGMGCRVCPSATPYWEAEFSTLGR